MTCSVEQGGAPVRKAWPGRIPLCPQVSDIPRARQLQVRPQYRDHIKAGRRPSRREGIHLLKDDSPSEREDKDQFQVSREMGSLGIPGKHFRSPRGTERARRVRRFRRDHQRERSLYRGHIHVPALHRPRTGIRRGISGSPGAVRYGGPPPDIRDVQFHQRIDDGQRPPLRGKQAVPTVAAPG